MKEHVKRDFLSTEAFKPTMPHWKVAVVIALALEIIYTLLDFAVPGVKNVLMVLPYHTGDLVGVAITYGLILAGIKIISKTEISLKNGIRFGTALAISTLAFNIPEFLISLAASDRIVTQILGTFTYPLERLVEATSLYILYNYFKRPEATKAILTALLGYTTYIIIFWIVHSQEFFMENFLDNLVNQIFFITVVTAASLIKLHEVSDLDKWKFTGILLTGIGLTRFMAITLIPGIFGEYRLFPYMVNTPVLPTLYAGILISIYVTIQRN